MIKEKNSEIKYRMKRLARKFCRRNDVYSRFDGSVRELVEKSYFSAYLLCLHENKNRIAELQKRIHTLEVYLEGTANFLILEGDSNNPIIRSVEHILHTTLNKSPKGSTVYQNLTKAKEVITGLLNCFPYDMANEELDVGQIDIVEKAEKFLKEIKGDKRK